MPVFELHTLPGLSSTIMQAVVLLLAVGSMVLAVLSYGTTTRPIPRRVKAILLIIRLAAVILALACLYRPTLEWSNKIHVKGELLLALDYSESMTKIEDAGSATYAVPENSPRREVVKAILDLESELFKELEENFNVTWITFSDTVTEFTGPLPEEIDGPRSIYSDVLERGKAMQAILLLGDGQWNAGNDPVEIVRQLVGEVFFYGIAIGQDRPADFLKDIRADQIRVKDIIALNSNAEINTKFNFLGIDPTQAVNTRLLVNGVEVESKALVVQSDGHQTIRFVHLFDEPGIHRIAVEIPALEGELDVNNNRIEKSVRVIKKNVTVLYIESFRWEAKFIARELGNWEKVDFRMISGLTQRNFLDLLPKTLEEWSEIDVFVLGNVERDVFPPAVLRAIQDRVEAGAGLLVIGGRNNFGAGGYAGSPIAELLPVILRQGDPYDEKQPVTFQRTTDGRAAFMLNFAADPGENNEAWNTLPPSAGLSSIQGVKHAAQVLLENQDKHPVLVAGEYGVGRTLALLTESTWRWVLNDLEDDVAEKTAESHEKFWRQLMLWLANRDDLKGVSLRMEGAVSPLTVDEGAEFVVGVTDENGTPVEGARVEIQIFREGAEDQSRPETVQAAIHAKKDEAYKLPYKAVLHGNFRVVAIATKNGEEIGRDEMEINVHRPNEEMKIVSANYDALRRMAVLTNGGFATPDASGDSRPVAEILRELLERAKSLNYTTEKTERLKFWSGDTPVALYVLMTLFCVLLAAEWFIRKRVGLV